MKYISTRNVDLSLGFCDTILSGLATDGGLYIPKYIPRLSEKEIKDLRGLSYQEIALFIFRLFIGQEIKSSKLRDIVNRSYHCFRNAAVTPLIQLNANEFLLELFHGPTLSFKDIAMQFIAELMDHILEERDHYITIVGATSGDTGAAAIKAFAGKKRINMYILFPEGRISVVQQKQMTTSEASNINVIAVQSSFDDCQKIVKNLFSDVFFCHSVNLSGINSINWARIMAQIVYYFVSSIALGSPNRNISFSVPTGNFGDIFAGYMAKMMGLPIEKLIIATNENDTLVRMFDMGMYRPEIVMETTSPAMDIQIPSNFERLLFEISGRNSLLVKEAFYSLENKKYFRIDSEHLQKMSLSFSAKRASMEDVNSVIKSVLEKSNYLVDPHTAVGIHAALACRKSSSTPMVTLATAHPSKFPDTVKAASGIVPDCPISLEQMMRRPEDCKVMNKNIDEIKKFIKKRNMESKIEP